MWNMGTWDLLQKKLVWKQLGEIKNQKILDFGSGKGYISNYYAKDNSVTAIEPNEKSISERIQTNNYTQLHGSYNKLLDFPDESFDLIICHNVLEYVENKSAILQEFNRILKPKGKISLLKHNKYGRVTQMVVLLNNFEHANEILSGENGKSPEYGKIKYYNIDTLLESFPTLEISKTYGIRNFWHIQQNQDIQKDPLWQKDMIHMELRVSEMPNFQSLAMFHHFVINKV